jgi:hypothetical protein
VEPPAALVVDGIYFESLETDFARPACVSYVREIQSQARRLLYADREAPPVSNEFIVGATAVALLAGGLLGALASRQPARQRPDAVKRCAQDIDAGAALLAASVLADSALEHFRGNYENRLMYVAPATAAASMAAAASREAPRALGRAVFAASTAIGITGLLFHLYNITKRPGGLSWNNLFYAAPVLAPGALTLSGILGLAARRLERLGGRLRFRRRLGEFGSALSYLISGGILATVAEVGLLHFRGAYHDPFMYVPVTVPPLAAASLAVAGTNPTEQNLRRSDLLLKLTAALGPIGTAFHAFGVQRNMGGWRNWTQNLFQGPPLPAPPSFTALALAGLGALRLLQQKARAR